METFSDYESYIQWFRKNCKGKPFTQTKFYQSLRYKPGSAKAESRKLVFFIHGVSTKNASYADALIRNIKKELTKKHQTKAVDFYSSFWGNLFNNKKYETVSFIDKDFIRACEDHPEYKGWYNSIYRYREWRNKFVNDFLGDFLIYQNPERGKIIRKTIFEQLNQFLYDHPGCDELHFVAHSLGSLILWDLLFSDVIGNDDPALLLRGKLSQVRLASITTLGSPLLFLKQFFDLDFSGVDTFLKKLNTENNTNSCKLRWVNIIHSSDLVAYPLKAAIENKIGNNLLYYDQYVWQCANGGEQTLINLGQFDLAMVFAAEDAHSSYFYDNIDGTITGRIIAYNLIGDTQQLADRCVTPK